MKRITLVLVLGAVLGAVVLNAQTRLDRTLHVGVAPPVLISAGSYLPDLPAEITTASLVETERLDEERRLALLRAEEDRVAAEEAERRARESARIPTITSIEPPRMPPPTPVVYDGSIHAHPALICIRRRESDRSDVNGNGLHDGGYLAYSGDGPYLGAYQFLQSTWNTTAASAGRGDLIGVDPRNASDGDQDAMAWALYSQAGSGPWGGTC